jgi:recombination protein RecT
MSNENQITPISKLRGYLADVNIKKRFEEILGKHAGAFMNSIINVVNGNDKLLAIAQSNPASIMTSALRAATMQLSVDPSLGQAAIVPYGNAAQFQIMYKGVTQLCIRTNQYATIHCTEVYKDEIKSYNPITGEVIFNDPSTFKNRYEDKDKNVVGHYAYFKLLSGFEKSDYMTTDEVMAHARKYSKSYQYDLRDKKRTSKWSTDPIPMGNKTVLLRNLTKYGVMSIEMQEAFTEDSKDFTYAQENAQASLNAVTGQKPIDAEFTEPPAGDGNGDGVELTPDEQAKKDKLFNDMELLKKEYYCAACDEEMPAQKGNKCPKCGGKLVRNIKTTTPAQTESKPQGDWRDE